VPAAHVELGRAGERAAARYLESLGWRVIGSGFVARRGEIDLICRDGERLVLVEVKTRSSARFGSPAQAIGPRKRRALGAAAAEYRALAGWRGPVEFAVVALTLRGGEVAGVELLDEAFG
jgi:putative endonuclease